MSAAVVGHAKRNEDAYSAGVDATDILACGCRLVSWLTKDCAAVWFASHTTNDAPGCLVNCAVVVSVNKLSLSAA